MIRSFRDKEAERLFNSFQSRKFGTITQAAMRKLKMLDAAESLSSLRNTPGNNLEALIGDRKGQHSVRINERYRVCFEWKDGDAYDVEIVDYH
jgi:toxin HigB-1